MCRRLSVVASDDARIADAYRFCVDSVRRSNSSFFIGLWLLPPDLRRTWAAAYTFCRLCDDAVDEPQPGAEPRKILNDMRAAVLSAEAGFADEPLWIALTDSFRHFKIDASHFIDIVDGCEMDLAVNRYESFDDLLVYCRRVASSVGLICVETCGYDDAQVRGFATDLGIAFQLTNILRDIREDAARGRVYIPLQELRKYSVSIDELSLDRPTAQFQSLMKFQTARARSYYASGARVIPRIKRGRVCTDMMFRSYLSILNKIDDADGDVLSQRITTSSLSKLRHAAKFWLRSLARIAPRRHGRP